MGNRKKDRRPIAKTPEDIASGKGRVPAMSAAGLLDDPDLTTAIECSVELQSLTLKGKRWTAQMVAGAILPRAYHHYSVKLDVNEDPFLKRIDDLKRELDSSLFKEEKRSRVDVEKRIAGIRKELSELLKVCEVIEFRGTIDALKFRDGDTLLSMRVPDDVIESFNRQKYRLEAYKMTLEPVFL